MFERMFERRPAGESPIRLPERGTRDGRPT